MNATSLSLNGDQMQEDDLQCHIGSLRRHDPMHVNDDNRWPQFPIEFYTLYWGPVTLQATAKISRALSSSIGVRIQCSRLGGELKFDD